MEAKNKRIIILNGFLINGFAHFNRLLAYAKAFSQEGYSTEIVSYRNINLDGYIETHGVKVYGLASTRIKNKYLRYICSFICLTYFVLFKISRKTNVLLYSDGEYLPLLYFLRRGNIFHEITENPEVVGLHRIGLRRYYRTCSKIRGMFVISQPLRKLLIDNGCKPDRIHVINMIVDASRFDDVKTNNSYGKYIGYCGIIRSDEKDGISFMLDLFNDYHHIYPDRKLLIAGPIYSETQKEIYINYLQEKSIEESVIFLGSLTPMEMPSFLMSAEMLLMTRRATVQTQYGFSTKLGEFLCSSRPVITSLVGDTGLFLTDKIDSLLVAPEDKNDFLKRMIWVSEHTQEANELGMKGKKTAEKCFNNKIESDKILSAFNNIRLI